MSDNSELLSRFVELNFSNYGQDEVDALQAWAFEALEALSPIDPEALDARLEAAGMMSVADLLKGAPLDAFVRHAGVNDLDTFGQWVEMKRAEFVRMQARYELGEKPKDDLYEWVTAHSAVFSEVHVNLKAAMPQPAAHLTIPGALEWDGDNGTHGVVGTHSADGEHSESSAAIATLKALGYTHNGGTHWKPPVGQRPDFDLIDSLRAQLDNTEQSRRSFFDLSQDLEKRLASLKAFGNEMIGAAFEGGSFEGGDIQDIAVKHGLLRIEQRTEECGEVCACREYGFPAECYRKTDLLKPADETADPAKCESCGDWGHIETEDSAHDCPECGPSVIERAVEAGVMNAPSKVQP